MVERGRPRMTIWRMRITCWIPKATNTHLSYVILIAFEPQQYLQERAPLLRYTYNACIVALVPLSLLVKMVIHYNETVHKGYKKW
jgi:hypothetical protein